MNLPTLARGGPRQVRSAAHNAETHAHAAARRQRGWLVPLGRAGYAANGVVYGIVGLLAAQAALGTGGGTTDKGGALAEIVQAPFGRVLLGLVAVGLAGYALWRLLQCLLDTERKGASVGGLVQRLGYLVAACAYFGLAVSAALMAFERAGRPDEEQLTQDHTAWLLAQPLGPWLVAAVGVIVIGVGVAQVLNGGQRAFGRDLRTDEMSAGERSWAVLAGRFGYVARGVVFGIVGVFLVSAARQEQPQQARGLGGALAALAEQPSGPLLLGVVAFGLIAYGVYMLVAARYRRMVVV
ncbi:MAG: DUF1206 domain-containing protein [Chloroflexota bacterium]|nr:DUF1206 domain-containing protein [Chloroflexota bacterium]